MTYGLLYSETMTCRLMNQLHGILTITKDSIINNHFKERVCIYFQKRYYKQPTPNNHLFENERVYAATTINNEWIALATNNSGVIYYRS